MADSRTQATPNPLGRAFLAALDQAAGLQGNSLTAYLERLERRQPHASPQELQHILDRQFRHLVMGSGAAAGGTAALPGVGLVTGMATVSAESLVFLDAAATYTLASAQLRGLDVHDPEVRRALILIGLLGSRGTALLEATAVPSISALGRLSASSLNEVNNRLLNLVMKTLSKRLSRALLGKLLPLGIGAVVGTLTNRRLATQVISQVEAALGAVDNPSALDLGRSGIIDAPDLTGIDSHN